MTSRWVRMIGVAALVAACASDARIIPTRAEAEQLLGEIVRRGQSGDVDAVCELGGPNCRDVFREAGSVPPPEAPPTVHASRVLAAADDRTGGVILELCGLGWDGRPYWSEMLITRHATGRLVAIEPIYWSSIQVEEDGTTGPEDRSRASCPPRSSRDE